MASELGEGWTMVGGRSLKKEKTVADYGKFDDGDLVSFYVTNLLNACRREWLEEAMVEAVAGLGQLADTFIPKWTNKAGKVFGFVKFKGVKDKWAL
ncbi:hypothetical protein SSX86_033078 [Deinandra increscens subsp. villosa]|uniref:Uncharacterized protein n=1 Tax=Deinandra increscens subsp. villosa TaxID=3103831 RepID=A0AAP0C5R1_9ASTR